jgi:hypothetical protein
MLEQELNVVNRIGRTLATVKMRDERRRRCFTPPFRQAFGTGGKTRRAGASLGRDHADTVLIFEPQCLAL